MKVSKITVDNQSYLGTIEGNVITGIANGNHSDYFKAKAMGELLTVTVGDAKNLVITNLTDVQQLEFKRVKSLWKLAEKRTNAHVTCGIFERLMSGGK
jgi:hypothetical protein